MNSDKKVCFVTSCLSGGGAERVVSILANRLALDSGLQISILALDDRPVAYALDSKIEYYAIKKTNRIQRIIEARKIIKKNDIIISFDYSICIRAYLASIGLRKKHIMSERNDPRFNVRRRIVSLARRYCYSRAQAVVFQTENARAFFPKQIRKKGVIICNPVDITKIPDQTEKGKKSNRIIAVGRLEPQKNFEMLINTFSNFTLKFPEYQLVIFGFGSEKEKLESQIKRLQLDSKIVINDFTSNIYEEMSNSAIYVSTSIFEGISNAMLEALCMGLPAIVTDCNNGGVLGFIENGVNGIVVNPKDDKTFYESLCLLASDNNLRQQMFENRFKIRNIVSVETIGEKWRNLL